MQRQICVFSVLAALCLGSPPLHAQQVFSFSDFSSTAGLQRNGSTGVANNGTSQVLRLTPASLDQVGSVWYATPLPLSKGFSTTFKFQISGTTSFNGDGFAFVIQNGGFCNGTSGAMAVAPTNVQLTAGCTISGEGGSIGYAGLTRSVAFEFDTFQNGSPGVPYGDLSNDELGIQSCGASANTPDHTSACNFGQVDLSQVSPAIQIADGNVHTATILYVPPTPGCEVECTKNLFITIDGQLVLSTFFDVGTLGLDPGDPAFVGFTAATGAAGGGNDNHDILSWIYNSAQTKTMGGPGTTTTFTFDTDTYKITGLDNAGGEQVTVDAFLTPASAFPTGPGTGLPGFTNETCVPYGDYSAALHVDTCVEFQVECQVSAVDTTPCNFDYELATGYDLPGDLPAIGGPDFLVAHGVNCPLTSNTLGIMSIFEDYEVSIKDPTTVGKSRGPSCFVATYRPSAAPITTGVGFVGWESPVVNNAVNQIKAGSTRPLSFFFYNSDGSPNVNLAYCNTPSTTPGLCADTGLAGSPATPWINIFPVGIACQGGAPLNTGTETSISTTGGSGFQNNGNGAYQANWKTLKNWAGSCANVRVTYSTGGAANVVLFPTNFGFQFN